MTMPAKKRPLIDKLLILGGAVTFILLTVTFSPMLWMATILAVLPVVAMGLLIGAWGSTNNVNTTINIHEAKQGDLIWKYDYVARGSVGSSPENLVNALMRNASRKFPYNEKK